MTHNTMKKRLCRKFNISPREARLALRKYDYDYEVAAETVALLKCGLTIEELAKGIEAFTKTVIRIGNGIAAGISAFGEAFAAEMKREEGGAANEDRNGNTTT